MPSIEHAASGRAACRACREKIKKGAVRVGVVGYGDWGEYMKWHHLGCYPTTERDPSLAKSFSGYWSLQPHVMDAIAARRMAACRNPLFGTAGFDLSGENGGAPPQPAAMPPSSQRVAVAPQALSQQQRSVGGGGIAGSQLSQQHELGAATQAMAADDVAGDEFSAEIYYGCFEAQIVGCRYYSGMAHKGEFVTLVREPHNPYDRNAVRVDNMAGAQVGHIKATTAIVLRRVLDAAAPGAPRVEATIPRDMSGIFSMPVTLSLYGSAADLRWTVDTLRLGGVTLKRGAAQLAAGTAGGGWNGDESAYGAAGRGALGASYALDPQKTQRELDVLFDKLADEGASAASAHDFDAARDAPALCTPLHTHQRQGVAWMLSRERQAPSALPTFYEERVEQGTRVFFNTITASSSTARPPPTLGGLLADDMGNGKTIQTLALILANPPHGVAYSSADAAGMAAAGEALTVEKDITRTVAAQTNPKVTAPAEAAIEDAFLAGWLKAVDSARALGGREPTDAADLAVLSGKELKALCGACGLSRAGTKAKMAARAWAALQDAGGVVALFAGDASFSPVRKKQRTATGAGAPGKGKGKTKASRALAAPAGRGTLVVAPLSVMENWVHQAQEHIAGRALKVLQWHGAKRHERASELATADLVVTSYGTLSAELDEHAAWLENKAAGSKTPPPAAALSQRWHRAVLDEAHTVRNRKTKAFKAATALHAKLRWALTGTPIQNSAADVFGVLAFLHAAPLADAAIFNRAIARPIREGDAAGLARLRLLLKTISLRRPKSVMGAALPPKRIVVQKVIMDAAHRECYNALFQSARALTAAAIELGTASEHYLTILECLMRLRQACCARALVPPERLAVARALLDSVGARSKGGKGKALALTNEEVGSLFDKLRAVLDDAELECAICLTPLGDDNARILRGCSHVFCKPCIYRVLETDPLHHTGRARCPMCRGEFTTAALVGLKELASARARKGDGSASKVDAASADDAIAAGSAPPPKVQALLAGLEAMRAEGDDRKAVVFSQFTSYLDIIERALAAAGWGVARIDGSKSAEARVAAQRALGDAGNATRVLLVSTKAGGQGLNLTAASYCFMMDLWWNAAVEAQAWDRVHRIGQTRAVTVTRFVCEDSIEEKLLELQAAKAAIGSGALRKLSAAEASKARVADLRALFEVSE